jgi:hypothetical protein
LRGDPVDEENITSCALPTIPSIAPSTGARHCGGARHRHREAAIQRVVFQHLRTRGAPGVFVFHPANGGYRKPVEAAILKGLGVVSGVPDVIAIRDGRTYALELKAEGGKPTRKQVEAIAAMKVAGVITGVAVGIDEALRWLEGQGLLRGRAS